MVVLIQFIKLFRVWFIYFWNIHAGIKRSICWRLFYLRIVISYIQLTFHLAKQPCRWVSKSRLPSSFNSFFLGPYHLVNCMRGESSLVANVFRWDMILVLNQRQSCFWLICFCKNELFLWQGTLRIEEWLVWKTLRLNFQIGMIYSVCVNCLEIKWLIEL
jgi:hypothetical protein